MITKILIKNLLDYADSIGLKCSILSNPLFHSLYLNSKKWVIMSIWESDNGKSIYWRTLNDFQFSEIALSDPNAVEILKEVIRGYL